MSLQDQDAPVEYRRYPVKDDILVGSDGSIWRLAPITPRKNGYRYVFLWKNNKRYKIEGVHVMVLTTFMGSRPEGMIACHNNGDATNNSVSNLRWDTPLANMQDREKHGNTARGENNPSSRWTEEEIVLMRRLRAYGVSCANLGKAFGLDPSGVWGICTGKTWKHLPLCPPGEDYSDVAEFAHKLSAVGRRDPNASGT